MCCRWLLHILGRLPLLLGIFLGAPVSTVRLALPDLPHHRVHIGVVPDLGELVVFEAIKSELRNSHPTTGRLISLEDPPVSTGDREVHRPIGQVL